MNVKDIATMLNLDEEVMSAVTEYDSQIDYSEIADKCQNLLEPSKWEETVKELQEYCGDDPQGMKILTINLHCLIDTFQRYREKGIPEKIFLDTMGFIPRFIKSHRDAWGVSSFTWAWWFPRQLSMNEFRVGEYEYEFFTDNGIKKMWIHIPADAKLAESDISAVYPFLEKYYPEYAKAQIVCDSWLLSPALKELLPENSNIIAFQNQFNVTRTDWESPWFMGWIWSRSDMPVEELPENTTLQRNVKKHLLAGGKIGSAYGEYRY